MPEIADIWLNVMIDLSFSYISDHTDISDHTERTLDSLAVIRIFLFIYASLIKSAMRGTFQRLRSDSDLHRRLRLILLD